MPLTRRNVLTGAGASIAALAVARPGAAQNARAAQVRVGVIFPSSTGVTPVRTSLNDFIGDAALQGTILAEARIGDLAAAEGIQLVLVQANAPTVEVAERTGRRMVATEDLDVLIGGVGEGQAAVLSEIAENAGLPFFNVGSANDELRSEQRRYTFHIEPSAAMYLDALVLHGVEQGIRSWFVVHENNESGAHLRDRAGAAIARHGAGALAGAMETVPGLAFYGQQLDAAARSGADAVLVALSEVDQVVFFSQLQNVDSDIRPIPFPVPNTQTRNYMAAFRDYAGERSPDNRIAAWDSTLEAHGADDLNTRYLSRWGNPMDPTAWSAYSAVKIVIESAIALGGIGAEALVDHLEDPDTIFDLAKGPGTSFRPWNHQLRQPLYVIDIDQDAEWVRTVPSTQVAIAAAVAQIPEIDGDANAIAQLDVIGDGPDGPLPLD